MMVDPVEPTKLRTEGGDDVESADTPIPPQVAARSRKRDSPVSNSSMTMAMANPQIMIPVVNATNFFLPIGFPTGSP